MSDSKIQCRCTAAFTLAGALVRPGDVVELTRAEAANLLHRGRIELIDLGEAADDADGEADDKAEAPAPARRGRKPKAANDADGE